MFDRATELRRRLAAGPTDFFVRQAPPLSGRPANAPRRVPRQRPRAARLHHQRVGRDQPRRVGPEAASPGEILMTDHEYGAMIWCWERAGQRQGLSVRTFPLPTMATDPGEIVDAAVRAMTPRTRLLFFSHVLSPTGLVLPAKETLRRSPPPRHPHGGGRRPRPGDDPAERQRRRRGLLHRQPAQVAARSVGAGSWSSARATRTGSSRCTSRGATTRTSTRSARSRSPPVRTPATTTARRRASASWSSRGRATSARGSRCPPRSTSRPNSAGTRSAPASRNWPSTPARRR